MKKLVNGKYIEMTTEEIAELEKSKREYEERQKNAPPTEADRLEAVEMAILEIAEVLANG